MGATEKASVASGADAGDGLRRRNVPDSQAGAVQHQSQVAEKQKTKKV